jgi:hypothetical protein
LDRPSVCTSWRHDPSYRPTRTFVRFHSGNPQPEPRRSATRPTYINCPVVWDKIILPHTMGQNRPVSRETLGSRRLEFSAILAGAGFSPVSPALRSSAGPGAHSHESDPTGWTMAARGATMDGARPNPPTPSDGRGSVTT